MTDGRVSPEILASATPVQSSLQQTFDGRSHTEIARFIATDHGWLMFGDMLLAPDGLLIADTLESAAAAMLALNWFHPSGIAINWHVFGPTKFTNPAMLQFTVRQIQVSTSIAELREDRPE